MKAEWRNRADFAEVADALGINTDDIASTADLTDTICLALYTTNTHDAPEWWSATLMRGADNILRLYGPPREIPDFAERLLGVIRDAGGDV